MTSEIVAEIVEIIADGGREVTVETSDHAESTEMEIDAGSTEHDRSCVCENCRASRAQKSKEQSGTTASETSLETY